MCIYHAVLLQSVETTDYYSNIEAVIYHIKQAKAKQVETKREGKIHACQ